MLLSAKILVLHFVLVHAAYLFSLISPTAIERIDLFSLFFYAFLFRAIRAQVQRWKNEQMLGELLTDDGAAGW